MTSTHNQSLQLCFLGDDDDVAVAETSKRVKKEKKDAKRGFF
jgi:hypothetical protein